MWCVRVPSCRLGESSALTVNVAVTRVERFKKAAMPAERVRDAAVFTSMGKGRRSLTSTKSTLSRFFGRQKDTHRRLSAQRGS